MKISVVIVIRSRGGYLAESLQSILNQSYPAHEIVLVDTLGDDGYIKGKISQINHPRVKCVFHPENNSHLSSIDDGFHASSGEIVCFLDENDKFKREKIGEVAKYFGENPQENAVSHACFLISRHGKVLSLLRPKTKTSLEDFLLRESLPMSSLAIRRSCVDELVSYSEVTIVGAGWVGFVARLLLSNIRLSVMDRPLCEVRAIENFAGNDLPNSLKSYTHILEAIFADPRCSDNMLRLRESALARIHLKLAYEAFVQGDGALGREMLRSSIYLDRSILDIQAYRFFFFLIDECLKEDNDLQGRISRIFEQLPAEMMWMMPHLNEVIARGFALRGARGVLWGSLEKGNSDLAEAVRLGCRIDQYFYYVLAEELVGYEAASGPGDVDWALRVLTPYLEKMSTPSFVRWFKGEFFANRAFREFDKGRYLVVLRSIQYAVSARPIFMVNRGLLATLFRSLARLRSRPV